MEKYDYNALYEHSDDQLKHIVWLIYKGMMEEYDPLGHCSTFGQYWDDELEEEVEYTDKIRSKHIKEYLKTFIFYNSDYIPAKKIDLTEEIDSYPVSKEKF